MPVTRRLRVGAPPSLAAWAVTGAAGRHRASRRSPSVYGVGMASGSARGALGALAVAVLCAEGAARALAPRDGVIPAWAPADPAAHFDADELARARRYGRGQRALGAAGAAAELALLGWLARRARDRDEAASLPAAGA